jgi:hypothetical protein
VPAFLLQVFWSDPSDSDAEMARGVHHNTGRGGTARQRILKFGPDITEAFCARENVQLVIRSHQYVAEGAKFMHSGRLVTLFSARNYFAGTLNDGALLLLSPSDDGCLRVRVKRLVHLPDDF